MNESIPSSIRTLARLRLEEVANEILALTSEQSEITAWLNGQPVRGVTTSNSPAITFLVPPQPENPDTAPVPKKRGGRKPGSKNKPKDQSAAPTEPKSPAAQPLTVSAPAQPGDDLRIRNLQRQLKDTLPGSASHQAITERLKKLTERAA